VVLTKVFAKFLKYVGRRRRRDSWLHLTFVVCGKRSNETVLVPINNDLERRIADAFEVFDHAGNKTVDVREIATIVRALGCCPTEAEIQEILMVVENPESPGSVHLSNFLPHISQVITEHK
jgi:Ca2+-binding EF-hand superfamily protein